MDSQRSRVIINNIEIKHKNMDYPFRGERVHRRNPYRSHKNRKTRNHIKNFNGKVQGVPWTNLKKKVTLTYFTYLVIPCE